MGKKKNDLQTIDAEQEQPANEAVEARALAPAEQEPRFLPAFPTKSQINEYKAFLDNYNSFVDKMLNEEVDYGIIPGVEKPSLFKPGAEKLEKLFFYRHKKIQVEKIIEPDFIKYSYRTEIYSKAGELVATCEGTCNSHEKKYRWRVIPEWEASEKIKATVEPEARKAKSGKVYNWYKVENTEVADLENTIMKMAQKRSYVGAILEATNSSGRFTQDVEDMDLGGTSGHRSTPRSRRTAAKRSAKDPKFGEYGEPLEQEEPEDDIPVIDADQPTGPPAEYECHECGNIIRQTEKDYSLKFYGKQLCRTCQRGRKKLT